MAKDKLEILFEDRWIIVVSKPAGMLSVGYPGFRGKTAQDLLEDLRRGQGKARVEAVHRLDRETSGVMMFAIGAETRDRIMNDWQEIVSERTYRCACAHRSTYRGGKPLDDEGTVDAPLAYNKAHVAYVPRKDDEKALKEAERAVTRYKVVKRGERYDLVECELETGRKNQIRAHMKHLGHPIAGDPVYGEPSASQARGGRESGDASADRLALHARVLAFTHPYTGEFKRFEVPEPSSFARLVEQKSPLPAEEAGANREEKRNARPSAKSRKPDPEPNISAHGDEVIPTRRRVGANGSKYIPSPHRGPKKV